MLGLIFIILTYLVVVGICYLIKLFALKFKSGKVKSEAPTTSKIYYVTNSKSHKKTVRKKPDIAIKGRLVERINEDEDSV